MTNKEIKQFDKTKFVKKGGSCFECCDYEEMYSDLKTFISQIKTNQRKKIITKIKTLQSANTEDYMISLEARFGKNDAFDEVIKKLIK